MSILDLPPHVKILILHYLPAKQQISLRAVCRVFQQNMPMDFKVADKSIMNKRYSERDALRSFFEQFGAQLRRLHCKTFVYEVCCVCVFETIACHAAHLRSLVVAKWHIPLGLLHQLPQLQHLRARSITKSEARERQPRPARKKLDEVQSKLVHFTSNPSMDLLGVSRLPTMKRIDIDSIDAEVVHTITSTTPAPILCIKSLKIQFNEISGVNMSGLATQFPRLESLSMTMAEVAAISYLPSLSKFEWLKKLHFTRCEIGGLGPDDTLPGSLTCLELYRCYNVRSHRLLAACHRLQEFSFFRGSLLSGIPTAPEILESLPVTAPLRTLAISDSEVAPDDILTVLASRPYPIDHLEVRQIRGSTGGFDCAKLCQYLEFNTFLVYLYLLNHRSVDDSIFPSLLKQRGLDTLVLTGTTITAAGLQQFCAGRRLLVAAELADPPKKKSGRLQKLEIQVNTDIRRDPLLAECALARVTLTEENE